MYKFLLKVAIYYFKTNILVGQYRYINNHCKIYFINIFKLNFKIYKGIL